MYLSPHPEMFKFVHYVAYTSMGKRVVGLLLKDLLNFVHRLYVRLNSCVLFSFSKGKQNAKTERTIGLKEMEAAKESDDEQSEEDIDDDDDGDEWE